MPSPWIAARVARAGGRASQPARTIHRDLDSRADRAGGARAGRYGRACPHDHRPRWFPEIDGSWSGDPERPEHRRSTPPARLAVGRACSRACLPAVPAPPVAPLSALIQDRRDLRTADRPVGLWSCGQARPGAPTADGPRHRAAVQVAVDRPRRRRCSTTGPRHSRGDPRRRHVHRPLPPAPSPAAPLRRPPSATPGRACADSGHPGSTRTPGRAPATPTRRPPTRRPSAGRAPGGAVRCRDGAVRDTHEAGLDPGAHTRRS